ncbi:MAG: bifunctional UDP-N-acetylglucosamine diphosphorylase/glucosamine-1-phosphate N-acetyltransferase GlmU [Moorellales bacterium]
MAKTVAVILAAGQGKRMRSRYPKVLHLLVGRPLLEHVLEAVREAGVPEQIIVVGHQAELVRERLGDGYRYAYQDPPLGTGHAVLQAEPLIPAEADTVLVACGDTPLLGAETLRRLLAEHLAQGSVATLLTAVVADPSGYGRVLRGAGGEVRAIVEERDAGPEVKRVREINSGTYVFERRALFAALREIGAANAQGEYYLPDVIAVLVRGGARVATVEAAAEEIMGINSRVELAAAEAVLRRRINRRLMENGVTIIDPESTYVEATVEVEPDTVLYPGTLLQGRTVIGEGCRVGPYVSLRDSRLGREVEVRYAVVEESEIGDRCRIGPFAYLRPGTRLEAGVKVGDFVEIKQSLIGEGSKVPHLSYVGDAVVGKGVNIGAGTITCNYDGERKWPTYIEDGAFIGSNTNLVAPVRVGRGAYVGAGSTITKDIPAEALGVARSRQTVVPGWQARRGRRKAENHEKEG